MLPIMLRESAFALMSFAVLAGCGSPAPSQDSGGETAAATPSAVTTPAPEAQPRTLEAATAAAQEWADRRSAEDYAGAWLLFNKQVRDGISQDDYVTLSETCGSAITQLPSTVTGVRMDGENRAMTRLETAGFQVSAPAVYEDGRWLLEPSEEFAVELGKPLDEIIAGRKAVNRCGDA